MFKYAIKSILTRKTVTFLYILALIVTITLSMVTVNISSQINEGFFNADSKYDVIIGPEGSSTQLLMSTLFFADEPLGTVSYKIVEDLKSRTDLLDVIPIGLADNFRGAKVVGATVDLLKDYELQNGELFKESFEVVLGYNVAKAYNLKIGDELLTTHGVGGDEHEDFHKVVGILEKTNTSYDNILFTDIHTIWDAHDHDHNHNHEDDEHLEEEHHEEEHHEEEHHEEVHEHNHDDELVTGVLVRTGSMIKANEITMKYNEKGMYTQAINPTRIMRNLMENIDLSKQVAMLLGGIVIVLAFIIIAIMTFLMLESISKDVNILRFLGMGRNGVFKYIMYQTLIQLFLGVAVSIVFSRVVLNIANTISSQLGIIIALDKVYNIEIFVVLFVMLICIIPTVVYILRKRVGEINI